MEGLDVGLARRAEDREAGGRAGMCPGCWRPSCTIISTKEVHSAEAGQKGNRKRTLETPPRPVVQGLLAAELQGMKSWILGARPVTAGMFINGWDQSTVEIGTSHRKDCIRGSPRVLVLFWPVSLNEICGV